MCLRCCQPLYQAIVMSFCFRVSGHVWLGSPGKYVGKNFPCLSHIWITYIDTDMDRYTQEKKKRKRYKHPHTHICLIQYLHQLVGSFLLHIASHKLLWAFSKTDNATFPFSITPTNIPGEGLLNRPSSLRWPTFWSLARVQGHSTLNACYIHHASTVSCQVCWFSEGGIEGRFRSKSAHKRAQPV